MLFADGYASRHMGGANELLELDESGGLDEALVAENGVGPERDAGGPSYDQSRLFLPHDEEEEEAAVAGLGFEVRQGWGGGIGLLRG